MIVFVETGLFLEKESSKNWENHLEQMGLANLDVAFVYES